MFTNRLRGKLLLKKILAIDQVRLVYFLSLLVGFLSALAAALLKNCIHYIHLLLTSITKSESGNLLYLGYPLAGIFLTFLFVKYIVRDNVSHGITRILFAISRKKSKLRPSNTWGAIVASTLTIGFGGSVGAEAPIVLSGSSLGSVLGSFFKLNYKNVTLLIGCGAAGAISGIFKAPIAGIVFTLEVLMLDLTLSSIVPLLISSVTAATVAYFLMGDKLLFAFNVAGAFDIANIPWYLLLGLVSGLISLYFSKMTLFLEGGYNKISNSYLRILLGGIVLGGLIYLFPPLFGEGYDTIMSLLQGNSDSILNNSLFSQYSGSFIVMMLFMSGLILLKVIASSSTNGAGGVGGFFAPTLFLGGVNGFFMSGLLNKFASVHLPDNRFVLVGMAGMMAGVMHAPLTAIFLIAEITGGYSLLIPLILTSTAAFITVRSFEKHSIYHITLAKSGDLITHDKVKAVLTRMNWKKEIETDLLKIDPEDCLGDLVKIIENSRQNIFPVIDKYNILEGIVSIDDIKEIMFKPHLYETSIVRDFMKIPSSYVDVKENIGSVMDAFRKSGDWNLPVLNKGYYVGIISKSRIYSAYRELLVEYSE